MLQEICWDIREGGCGVREILLGMNSRSFELLFILRWGNHATFRIK